MLIVEISVIDKELIEFSRLIEDVSARVLAEFTSLEFQSRGAPRVHPRVTLG